MNRMARMTALLFAAVLILADAGPAVARKAPECVKNGVEYGVVEGNFREEWFSYQERAESYLAGECWEAALSDYERGIELRTSLDRAADTPGCDTRRARSYGMHFQDWFGHRGRGIALFELGRIDDAVTELELSLRCTESSQAQFYLDKARTEKLKTSGQDQKNPEIGSVLLLKSQPRVDFVKEAKPAPATGHDRFVAVPYYFTGDEIASITEGMSKKDIKALDLSPGWGSQVVSWKSSDEIANNVANEGDLYALVQSSDDQGVQSVEAGKMQSPYVFAQKFRADVFPMKIKAAIEGEEQEAQAENMEPQDLFVVALDESGGEAVIKFSVTDLMGKHSEKSVSLVIDREGPQVTIQDVKVTKDGKARIRGTWDDASGIKNFLIGGMVPEKVGANGFEVTAPLEDAERVRFEAMDPAGNTTTGVIVVGQRTKGTMITPPIRWTRLMNDLYKLAALDAFDAPLPAVPPSSDLDSWRIQPRVESFDFDSPYRVAVDVELYWNEIQSTMGTAPQPPQIVLKTRPQTVYSNQLYVEGSAVGRGSLIKSLLVDNKSVMGSPRSNAFFNKLVYLRPGKNIIKIKAIEEGGLTAEQTLAVTRIVPRVQSVAERLAVSMLPFYQDPTFQEIGEVAYDNLATALIQQRRFRYVDRGKVDVAIREMRLAGAGLVDPATAVRAGKMSSAEAIIIGVVRETPTSIEVKAQVVDVETSRIMVTRDAYHQDKSLGNLQFITCGLAVKIQNAFPIVQGNIQESRGNSAVITVGRRNRIIPGMRVVFFRIVPKTDASGQPVGADTQKIGEGTVTAISSSASTVAVGRSQTAPQANDLAITK